MSSRTLALGLLVGLSAAAIACGAEPTSSGSPRLTGTSGSGNSTSSTAGTGNTGNTGNVGGTGDTGAGGTFAAGGTSDPGTGGSSPIAGSTSTGTAGTAAADPCMPIDSQKMLPLAVDGPFVPGGYFFDPAFPENANGIIHATCDSRSTDTTHYGSCHKWSFTPMTLGLDPTTNTMITYGGVFWLAGSATNWGTGPGVNVAPGAQTVKFSAWGASGGEVVTFSVGGVTGTACLDTVNFGTMGALKVTLTTTPTDYVINLAGQTYPDGVIGGFSWSTENPSTTVPVVFNVDDIRWTSDAS